jgi:hypothetical protein
LDKFGTCAQASFLAAFRSGKMVSGGLALWECIMAPCRASALFLLVGLSGGGLRLIAQEPAEKDNKPKAPYMHVYDIRDLVAKPSAVGLSGPAFRKAEPAARAARIVQALSSELDRGKSNAVVRESVKIVNGTQLVVHAAAKRHAEIAELLAAFRRLADLAVSVRTQLYEVDGAFYTKLKNAKPADWEEEERLFLAGTPPKGDDLFKLLKNQKKIQAGEHVKVNSGEDAALLSWHQAGSCLPGPEQVRKRDRVRQTFLEGVSFFAEIVVSWDRRFVRLQFTEKAAELQQIKKVRRITFDGTEAEAEVPFLTQGTHERVLEVPDGGSILVPVHYRPASAKEKDRWWVLGISPRIIIEAEERAIFEGSLEPIQGAALLPELVADILKNPRLKTTREFYGSPDDARFALVSSAALTWPKEFRADVPGYRLVSADGTGKRLLGIRVDKMEYPDPDAKGVITVTLVNAGGNANGAVVGGCTLRYAATLGKGWVVELLDK